MKLSKLLTGIPYENKNFKDDPEISMIASDSRKIVSGGLFVCIRGETVNGHDFAKEAWERGAAVIIIEEGTEKRFPKTMKRIVVKNTRRALSFLWRNRYGDPVKNIRMVGVTGTNGKTSVCHYLKSVFEDAGMCTGIIGTVSCGIGDRVFETDGGSDAGKDDAAMTTPDPEILFRLLSEMKEEGAEIIVMECSSHALELHKTDAIRFEVGVFTNLSHEHLDFHKTPERYFHAKTKLFRNTRCAVVNIGDPYGKRLVESEISCPAFTCSAVGDDADFGVKEIKTGENSAEYRLSGKDCDIPFDLRIHAGFALTNAMLAAATAHVLGIPNEAITSGIRRTQIPGRMEKIAEEDGVTVFCDYAHTPAAMEAVLSDPMPGKRKIVLFGCGGDRDREKRPMMGKIACQYADRVYLTSDNARMEDRDAILHDILEGTDPGKDVTVIPDRRVAILEAVSHAEPGDVIYLLGKGHEKHEINATGKHPFDEAEIVREAFAYRIPV